jgi:hypothetical protein
LFSSNWRDQIQGGIQIICATKQRFQRRVFGPQRRGGTIESADTIEIIRQGEPLYPCIAAHPDRLDKVALRPTFQPVQLRLHGSRRLAMKPFTLTAVVVLALVALVHLLRLFTGWGVVVTSFAVPVWWSAPIVVIFGRLAFLVWREARGQGHMP